MWQSSFWKAFPEHREEKRLLYEKGHGKYQLNLWYANELVLTQAGILREHLSFPGICTCCNPEIFVFPTEPAMEKEEIYVLSGD